MLVFGRSCEYQVKELRDDSLQKGIEMLLEDMAMSLPRTYRSPFAGFS
jgi:hypothetical protein